MSLDDLTAPGLSMFGEQLTVQRTPIIELSSAYGTSKRRDVITTANNGAVTSASGELKVSTSATANGSAVLRSARRGRYVPGHSGEAGVGMRLPVEPTGNQVATWGLMSPDEQEGLYFGRDATGLYVARVTGGVETKIRQPDWNVDAADGEGPSFLDLDITSGYIYQIRFSWYGHGQIVWGVASRVGNDQTFIPLHQEVFAGISLATPNLPIHVKVDNGGDAKTLDAYVGGRSYNIVGQYVPKFRFTGQDRGSVATGTTATPLVTFKNKTGFEDRGVLIDGFVVNPVTEDCILEIRLDGTLTGASYGTPTNYSAGETAMEVDTSASAISGGEVIYSEFVAAGQRNQSEFTGERGIDMDIPQGQPITLCARTLSGTGTTVSFFRLKEEW